jgi:hypothetical protein
MDAPQYRQERSERLPVRRPLRIPKTAEAWSLTSLREKLIKIGARVVSHGRYVTSKVAVSRQMFN